LAGSGYVVFEGDVPAQHAPGDTASARVTIDGDAGSEQLIQQVIRFARGWSQPRGSDVDQEVLYVVSGWGMLSMDDDVYDLEPGTGVYVVAGERYRIENPGPETLLVVSVLTPQREAPPAARRVTTRFEDQPELRADENRTFRYLVNQDAGCHDVTQFVGIVQPCRAPDHSHTYDEVGYVIEGEGFAHIGDRHVPLKAGSCFHLPPQLVHCIENSGTGVMRIMGVFHPSGDPASRAYQANK
jgi:mannose-6-phosphate isomerase-like protein (cupin superfamily)